MVFTDGHEVDLKGKLSEMQGGEVVLDVAVLLQAELFIMERD